ncbi:hypothetical protein ACS91J_04390 [Pectobacterium carotovorum]|uniref:hypothetical protein n=1 Tax=Pectobacterium polonicum TaxID=2485124 RepID=UPI002360637E|nr:hypothetical protein [Pectobacterium polonicum]MDC9820937.1 hypothetical protein [Pectobacterium polonicum]
MKTNITISLSTPHVTKERYRELTGIDENTLEDMLNKDGRLAPYRHRLRKDGKRELVLINLAALTVDALASHDVKLEH